MLKHRASNKSHDSATVVVGGTKYAFLAIMSREAGTSGLNPRKVIGKWGRLDEVYASASAWFSGEAVLDEGSALYDRDGYPSLEVNAATGEALMADHIETGERTCRVQAKGLQLSEIILGEDDWQAFTPTLTGTGSQPSYTTQSGRYMRRGNMITVAINIVVNGAITLTGDLSVAGLPFPADAPVPSLSASCQMNNKTAAVTCPFAKTVDGGTTLTLNHETTTGNSPVAASEVSSNFQVQFSMTYRVK